MAEYIEALGKLINELSKLPGIGRRSAVRLAYHILEADNKDASALANAIIDAKENVKFCELCGDFHRELDAPYVMIPLEMARLSV